MEIKQQLSQISKDVECLDYCGLNILADTLEMVAEFMGCPSSNIYNKLSCSMCLNADICRAVGELHEKVNDKICEIEESMFKE